MCDRLLVLNNFLRWSFSRIVYIHNLGCYKSENAKENIEFSFDQKFLNFVLKQILSTLVLNMSLLRTEQFYSDSLTMTFQLLVSLISWIYFSRRWLQENERFGGAIKS